MFIKNTIYVRLSYKNKYIILMTFNIVFVGVFLDQCSSITKLLVFNISVTHDVSKMKVHGTH